MPNLIPVDYDPFLDAPGKAPQLIPVDYDPFASSAPAASTSAATIYNPFADASAAPKLVPVDYDPFADNPGAAPRLVPVDYDPFADVTAAAPTAGASPQQPNLQPSLADSGFRSFPSAPSPDSFFAPNLPASSFSPSTQGGAGAAAYSPSNTLTPLVGPTRPPIIPDVARRFSQLENPPPRGPAFDPTMSLFGLIPQTWPENMSLLALISKIPAAPAAAPDNLAPSLPPPGNWIGPQPAFTGASGASALDGFGAGLSYAENPARIQLAQQGPPRRGMSLEDLFDPLAPLRVDLYNAARRDLEQIQPQNYRLSVPSLRAPGSAPTNDEIGELKYAYRIAQQTQPLADTASQIARLVEPPRAQNHRTVAVLRTSKGLYIASSGETAFEAGQLDAINRIGATSVTPAGKGIDAEIAAFGAAEGEPQFIAASRPFCPACRKAIEARGGFITSPTTAVFPRSIPSVAFPSTVR